MFSGNHWWGGQREASCAEGGKYNCIIVRIILSEHSHMGMRSQMLDFWESRFQVLGSHKESCGFWIPIWESCDVNFNTGYFLNTHKTCANGVFRANIYL